MCRKRADDRGYDRTTSLVEPVRAQEAKATWNDAGPGAGNVRNSPRLVRSTRPSISRA